MTNRYKDIADSVRPHPATRPGGIQQCLRTSRAATAQEPPRIVRPTASATAMHHGSNYRAAPQRRAV